MSQFVSQNNSTNTLLNNGETFTGKTEDVGQYDALTIALKTDTTAKLYADFSVDGVNWDSTLTYQVSANINEVHKLTITRRYFRIRITNDSGTNQTYLRAQCLFGSYTALSAPMNLSLQQDADAIAVRPSDYKYEVALGRHQNQTTWNKFGYNDDIDVGTETIWSVGGLFSRITTAQTLSIASSSANDTAAGTGAQSIIIYGVNQNYENIIEVVTLNGTTPVITNNLYFGVNRMSIYLAGSNGANIGNINATGGTIQAQIPITAGSTQHAFFFVAKDSTALMDYLLLNAARLSGGGGDPVVTVKGFVTSLVSGARYEVFRKIIDTAIENTVEIKPTQPFVIGEKSLIEFQATTDTANTNLSCRFSLIQVKNIFI
jgi:hypothetical protein